MTLTPRIGTLSILSMLALGSCISPIFTLAAPTYHLIKSYSLPGDGGWDYLNVDSQSRRLYIARFTRVTIVNIDNGKVVGEIPGTNGVHGVALDQSLGRGYTSNGRSNSVTVFNLKTFQKIADIPVGQGPDAILFDPATKRVFTFNGQGQSFTAIDTATNKVLGTIALPGRPEFAATDGVGHLYDNIEDKNSIASINARTLKIDHVWPITPGEGPSGLTIDAKNRRLFAVCDNQKMVVVNADTGAVVATPTIGNGPDASAYDPTEHLAFGPNGRDGTLTVVKEVSPNSYQVLQTLTTQAGARTIALDTKTHRVITVAAKTLPAAPGDNPRHRNYVPGTFVLLEYGP